MTVQESPVDRYAARFRRVLEYVDQHPGEELGVARLAAVAVLSAYHFHRQFSALFGIGVARYVQLSRLKRATHQLAYRRPMSVLDVALDNGYLAPEAFARALRRHIGQSPRQFRDNPDWEAVNAALRPIDEMRLRNMPTQFQIDDVECIDFPTTPVAVLEHRGDPRRLGDSIRRFIDWRRRHALSPQVSATYNICYDDPQDCEPQHFRFDLCVATPMPIAPNPEGVVAGVIPGGRCARLRISGPDALLDPAARFLYGQWLPQSDEEPRDYPFFLRRVTFFPEVPEANAVSELYLPLQ
jgi:AraC family transcriptional regulator